MYHLSFSVKLKYIYLYELAGWIHMNFLKFIVNAPSKKKQQQQTTRKFEKEFMVKINDPEKACETKQ